MGSAPPAGLAAFAATFEMTKPLGCRVCRGAHAAEIDEWARNIEAAGEKARPAIVFHYLASQGNPDKLNYKHVQYHLNSLHHRRNGAE